MKQPIEIEYEKYIELIQDQMLLNALIAAGVDNWDGYDYALEIRFGDQPEED
jgi:hypothetical protein